jgi:gp178
MNKQKAVEILKNADTLTIQDTRTSNLVDMVIKSNVIATVELIDEPQKPLVQQFVADWYEENKDDFETNLFQLIESLEVAPCEEDDLIDFIGWLIDKDTKPFQTLVNMHQFGYEVEEEKRYTVKMRTTNQPLFYNSLEKKLFFSLGELATQFTFKQLEEAGFDWVFDCPGIEIEEVEE